MSCPPVTGFLAFCLPFIHYHMKKGRKIENISEEILIMFFCFCIQAASYCTVEMFLQHYWIMHCALYWRGTNVTEGTLHAGLG